METGNVQDRYENFIYFNWTAKKTDQPAIRHDGNIVYAGLMTSRFLKAVFYKFYLDLS